MNFPKISAPDQRFHVEVFNTDTQLLRFSDDWTIWKEIIEIE